MNIAVDIDGVLCNFTKAFVGVLQKVFPEKQIPPDYEPEDWNYTKYLNRAEMAMAWRTLVGSENFWFNCEALPGLGQLQTFISTFRHKGINIIYCTSRSETMGDTVLVQTRNWLAQRGCMYANCTIIPVDGHDKKAAIYRLLNVQYSIDDKWETVAECQAISGHSAWLLDQPWNRSAAELPRISSVREYCELVQSGSRKVV
jgi:uncharacterized HAD superfamily protein